MSINLQSDKIEKLNKIQSDLSYSLGEPQVPVTQLMNSRFILENTDFDSWENFLGAAGIKSETDFSTPSFNEFIKTHTRFSDWEEMLIHSSNEYLLRREAE